MVIVLKWCFSGSFRYARSIYKCVRFIWRRLIFFEVLCLLSALVCLIPRASLLEGIFQHPNIFYILKYYIIFYYIFYIRIYFINILFGPITLKDGGSGYNQTNKRPFVSLFSFVNLCSFRLGCHSSLSQWQLVLK